MHFSLLTQIHRYESCTTCWRPSCACIDQSEQLRQWTGQRTDQWWSLEYHRTMDHTTDWRYVLLTDDATLQIQPTWYSGNVSAFSHSILVTENKLKDDKCVAAIEFLHDFSIILCVSIRDVKRWPFRSQFFGRSFATQKLRFCLAY